MEIYDVFISYRRSDGEEYASALRNELTKKGLRVFLDTEEMEKGRDFPSQLSDNIKKAPNYILVATPDVFKFREGEDWVLKEIETALDWYYKNKEERNFIILLPKGTQIPEKKELPQSIERLADIDYSDKLYEDFDAVLKIITRVNRCSIWHSSHRWLCEIKKEGSRFAGLDIAEGILPDAKGNKRRPGLSVTVSDEENEPKPIMEAIEEITGHIQLTGEGGIGKTTALINIMNSHYENKSYSDSTVVPIFIDLSFAPDTYGMLYENGKSSFIRRAVYKQIRTDLNIKQISLSAVSDIDEVFSTLPYDIAVKPVMNAFSTFPQSVPEYLLLLDGLNEVSLATVPQVNLTVMEMVIDEINTVMEECPNVRIILTGRNDDDRIDSSLLTKLKLTGKKEADIVKYLEDSGFSKEKTDCITRDKNLLKVLEIPLFLTMYATLSEKDAPATRGEILKTFFNERRENIPVYTEQGRLKTSEGNVKKTSGRNTEYRISSDILNFILDFILPKIAEYIEKEGLFHFRISQVEDIIESVLTDTCNTAVCGIYGQEIFSKYRMGQAGKSHTHKIAREILSRLGDNLSEISENIISCSVSNLGILHQTNSRFGFVHQHIRDYFASVSLENTLKLSVYLYEEGMKEDAYSCMASAFKDKPVSAVVRGFLGEILNEQKYAPAFKFGEYNISEDGPSLTERALDIYRNSFDREPGYALYSLIEIMKEARESLAGVDLSELDLRKISLNGAGLGIYGLCARLDGAMVNADSLFASGHREMITGLSFNEDGTMLVASDREGLIKIWETKTGNLIKSFDTGGYILDAIFKEGKIITLSAPDEMSDNFTLCRIDLKTGEILNTRKVSYTYSFKASDDKELIMLISHDKLTIFNTSDFSTVNSVTFQKGEAVQDADFVYNNTCIAVLKESEDNEEREIEIIPLKNEASLQIRKIPVKSGVKSLNSFDTNKLFALEIDSASGNIGGRIYNLSLNEIKSIGLNSELLFIFNSFSKYNKVSSQLLVAFNERVNLYSGKNLTMLNSISLSAFVNKASYDSFGKQLAIGTHSGDIEIYNTESFSLTAKIKYTPSKTDIFTFTPDSKYIVTYTRGSGLKIFDSETLTLKSQKRISFFSPLLKLELSPDGRMLSIPNHDGLFDSDFIEGLIGIPGLQSLNRASTKGTAVFSSNSEWYALRLTGNTYGYEVYDAKSHEPLLTLSGLRVVGFTKSKVIALNEDETLNNIITVDVKNGQREILDTEGEKICSVSSNDNFINAISEKGKIFIWNNELTLIKSLTSPLNAENGLRIISISPDERFIIEHNFKETIIRKTDDFKACLTVSGSFLQITSEYALFSSRETGGGMVTEIYSLSTFKKVYSCTFHSFGTGEKIAVSHDNKKLLMGGPDNSTGLFGIKKKEGTEEINLEYLGKITAGYGLEYIGVDLTDIITDRPFTDKEKEILRQYGAII